MNKKGQEFSWVKFGIIFVPFVILMFIFAPSIKWKLMFSVGGAIGIWLALIGKSGRFHK